MKVTHFILLVLLVIFSHNTLAQNHLSPIDRLNGMIMEKQLFIKYDESTNSFLYYKDEHRGTLLQINQNDLFTIKGTDNGKYTLAIEFYNPLRVKFNFDETRIADPAIEAINSFISKFPIEFVQNNGSIQKKVQVSQVETDGTVFKSSPSSLFELVKATTPSGDKTEKPDPEKRKIDVNDYFSSYILSQWVYELYTALNGQIVSKDSASFVSLFRDISQFENLENYLYGKIAIGDDSKSINDWILEVQKKMYDMTSAKDFWDQLNMAKEIYRKLQQSKLKAENALSYFFNLITYKYDERIAPLFEKSQENKSEHFKKYCMSTVSLVNVLIEQRKQNKDDVLTKFNVYIEALQKFYSQFHVLLTGSGSTPFVKVLQTSQIRHDDGIIKSIYVSATKLDDDGKEHNDQGKTVNFSVSRWNSMYPIVSTGSLFTNSAFPSYTLDSTNAVVNVSRKKIRATPALYLNFYTGLLKNDYAYFFLQVGIAPFNENGNLLVPIGVGISIGGTGTLANRITLSGGFLPAFIKELNKVTVGEKLNDMSALKNDLSYKLFTTGYFSINVSLFK